MSEQNTTLTSLQFIQGALKRNRSEFDPYAWTCISFMVLFLCFHITISSPHVLS